ncbi:LCP family protein [Bacillaceae bacterium S4-13-58]
MATSRSLKNKRKKKRTRRIWLLSILIFLLLGVGYIIFEYQAGKKAAMGQIGNKTSENEQEFDENFQGADNKDNKIYVLLLGVDSRGEEVSRTDTIMIGQYDPDNQTAKLVSIMRDTYVEIPGYQPNKINASFAFGGPELLRKTIAKNFGIETEYYAIVDFKGFTQIVDTIAPDGVEVNVEKRMFYSDRNATTYIDLYPGVQKLDGEQLLDYARFRNDSESDFGRVRRQQEVISLLKDELISLNGVVKAPRLIGTIQPFIKTNMGSTKMFSLGTDFLLNPPDDIESFRIPVEGSYWDKTHSHAGAVLEIDKQMNIDALNEFFNEKDATEEASTSSTE